MTSKEKIREILSVYHEYAKYYDEDDEWEKIDFNYDAETFHIFEEDVEKVKEIIKDLEMLEILKKVIRKNIFTVGMLDNRPNGKTWLSCEDFGITLETEDYYKIRKGLNDGK